MVKPRVTMNSHKNTLSNIFCKIRPRTWSARSCVFVCVCMCVLLICVCVYVYSMYMHMPIMAVKIRNVHCIKNPCALGATCSVSICVRYRSRNRRMKANFLTARNCCKRLKSIFRRFLFFCFFFCLFVLSPSPFRHVYKISITIKS